MSAISATVWDDVKIVYQSPCCLDPKNARFVLLADYHDDEPTQRTYSKFMEALAGKKNILLAEGCEARCRVTGSQKDNLLKICQISKRVGENLKVIGWDYYTHLSDNLSPAMLQERANLLNFLKTYVDEAGSSLDSTVREKLCYLISEGEKQLKEDSFCAQGSREEVGLNVLMNPDVIERFTKKKQLFLTGQGISIATALGTRLRSVDCEKAIRIEGIANSVFARDFPIRTAYMIHTIKHIKIKIEKA